MIDAISNHIKQLMAAKNSKTSPIEAILMDDAFCTMMMQHRMSQGMKLPEQSPSVDLSSRLSYLHALASGTGVAEARELSDMTGRTLKKISELKDILDPEIREKLVNTFKQMTSPGNRASYFAGQYILYGEERIAQSSIPLHQSETSDEDVLAIVSRLLERTPDAVMTISDANPLTKEVGFIRVGLDPKHFSFPETGAAAVKESSAILHYEIDHPGGDMVFFTTPGGGEQLDELMMDIEDSNPLYINEMPQLMAVNSLYLQQMGAFCVPSGDTCITIIEREGVLTAAERPDLTGDADDLLFGLFMRDVPNVELLAMSDFLHQVEMEDDYDWDTVEKLYKEHPDILGHQEMKIERSHVFGISRSALLEHALRLCEGDEETAQDEVEEFVEGSAQITMPEGRLHLYVANLASKDRYKDALPAFNRISGRQDEDMIFVLSDSELDFGDDPRIVSTMRKLDAVSPDPEMNM
jgi:hypothetical protein